jgi:hypothetical protein
MTLRDSAALALLVWYLLVRDITPPRHSVMPTAPVYVNGPSRWTIIDSFPTQKACERDSRLAEYMGRCVPANDPRLSRARPRFK